jgi:hypothetical protein
MEEKRKINKGKREESDAKAMEVYYLSKSMSQKDIARYLGHHPVYVCRLLKKAKMLLRWTADNIDGKYHLAAILNALEKQANRAFAKAEACDEGSNVAVGYEKIGQEALAKILKIMQESGFIFRMPEQFEESMPFDDPESCMEYMELRARALARRKASEKEGK